MLTLGLVHPTEHAHQHLVRRVTRIELAAQLRNPQVHPIGRKPRRDQRELVTEPAPRALPDYHSTPAAIRALQVGKQPRGLLPSLPRHRARLANIEELNSHRGAERLNELPRVAQLPTQRRLRILIVLG
jgi:hypothetical protein